MARNREQNTKKGGGGGQNPKLPTPGKQNSPKHFSEVWFFMELFHLFQTSGDFQVP